MQEPLDAAADRGPAWVVGRGQWAVLGLSLGAALLAFLPGLQFMVAVWDALEEYSYGYFIPLVSAFLIWQRSDVLRGLRLDGRWGGLWLVGLGVLLGLLGDRSAVRLLAQYGFVVALFGVTVCSVGWRGLRLLAVPLGILFLMIPLPQFLLRELSQSLQLLSSQLGVAIIRAFDISVFLEGNVIDLGSFKLQVVEACNGLRYLFPLLVMGLLAAYFFQGPVWQRVLIVLSTVPLTIVMNSLRIGLIGISVEYWGREMAEGLLHDIEGFFVFALCLLVLVAEMALLARLGPRGQSLREAFGLEFPLPLAADSLRQPRPLSRAGWVGLAVLAGAAALTQLAPSGEQIHPARTPFAAFPMRLDGGWIGQRDRLDRDVLATLAVDDHLIANFSRPGEPWVNVYSAWYDQQSSGESTHSPRTCIPGGGWAITSIEAVEVLPDGAAPGAAVRVNRAVIRKGESQQLVYYWFRQRGRTLTDEFAVKWFILQDGLMRDRSDGALLRLVTPVAEGEPIERADARLRSFLGATAPRLAAHIPD